MIVKDIVENLELIIGNELPDYDLLDFVWMIEKNHFRNTKKKYGVRPLESNNSFGTIQRITADHTFEIILTNGFKNNGKDDMAQRNVLYDLYDKYEKIAKAIHARKVNMPQYVLLVSFQGTDQAEMLEGENFLAILRARFNIRYKNNLF